MERLTLKTCIEVIESTVGRTEDNWNILLDVFQEFTTSEAELEYAHRHIIRFNDTTWGEHFQSYLLPKDGTETNLVRFFELVFDPRRIKEETQQ